MPGPHKWRHRFKDQVCRWTLPREAILNLLSRTSRHLSAKDIYVSLHRSYPGLGLTTVYRTLDLLVRSGLVNKYAFRSGESRYEFNPGEKKEHHHHLLCTRCGKIIDYSDFVDEELELVKKTEQTLAKKYKFVIHDHNVVFYGLCETCRKAKGGSA
jgi:Fur family ferric uptake transcriptional regulator